MRKFSGSIIAIFILVVSGAISTIGQDIPKCSEANGLKTSEAKEIVKAHNNSRDDVSAAKLTWDCQLAARAQAAADSSASGSASALGAGEIRMSSFDGSLDVRTALDIWREERHDWDAKAGTCETGRVCNHWAQIISPSTTRFGCGINRKGKGSSKAVLVCVYDPARM